MNTLKSTMLLLGAMFFTVTAFGQVSLNVSKPLSERDKMEVTNILKSFDASSYKVDMKTEKGTLMTGRATAKGLAAVGQKNTTRPGAGSVAATNTNINIFKNAAAATNTNINIFKTGAMSSNTNINIFVQGNFNKAQLSQMDKLYNVLSKYQ
ncbi:hypothetical protein OQY15_17105 [Pedobacter sp. MC2016-15]|uniref:hypothetical protein n=1 Tax=Pedobacter sp. MC2016-15 TaxID=2994473 RepID=UPI0022460CAE|nr:hypothetical protein [Pedobacter sp. MC2016-15]MCX2480826.1 hypothetical protein [Pedobacter sp. MC2016-15]